MEEHLDVLAKLLIRWGMEGDKEGKLQATYPNNLGEIKIFPKKEVKEVRQFIKSNVNDLLLQYKEPLKFALQSFDTVRTKLGTSLKKWQELDNLVTQLNKVREMVNPSYISKLEQRSFKWFLLRRGIRLHPVDPRCFYGSNYKRTRTTNIS